MARMEHEIETLMDSIDDAFRRLKELRGWVRPKPWRWIARVGRKESVHVNEASARKIAGKSGTVTAVYR